MFNCYHAVLYLFWVILCWPVLTGSIVLGVFANGEIFSYEFENEIKPNDIKQPSFEPSKVLSPWVSEMSIIFSIFSKSILGLKHAMSSHLNLKCTCFVKSTRNQQVQQDSMNIMPSCYFFVTTHIKYISH